MEGVSNIGRDRRKEMKEIWILLEEEEMGEKKWKEAGREKMKGRELGGIRCIGKRWMEGRRRK